LPQAVMVFQTHMGLTAEQFAATVLVGVGCGQSWGEGEPTASTLALRRIDESLHEHRKTR